jgi:hypothetical protein
MWGAVEENDCMGMIRYRLTTPDLLVLGGVADPRLRSQRDGV